MENYQNFENHQNQETEKTTKTGLIEYVNCVYVYVGEWV